MNADEIAEVLRNGKVPRWRDLFPEGRHLYYEGKRPAAFAKDVKKRFGFDPREGNPGWSKKGGYRFFCPAEHLDAVYGEGSPYPLGS